MLKKRADGHHTDKFGYIAAMMMAWNAKVNGVNHYIFLLRPFDPVPFDIASNGVDNSVLLSEDMYKILATRGACRPLTDEEAQSAIDNAGDIVETNQENQASVAATEAIIKAEAEKRVIAPPEEPVRPEPKTLVLAPEVQFTEDQRDLMALARLNAAKHAANPTPEQVALLKAYQAATDVTEIPAMKEAGKKKE